MALQLDTIRATADRIAASHLLDVVELEFSGGAKFRTLRVLIEKNAETRARLAAEAAAPAATESSEEDRLVLPKDVPVELLSFVTHEDCAVFTQDFGTVLDVEDLIPGADYTLEVSSPGLDRRLAKPQDFKRFTGSLIKLQTFTAIDGNRHFQGRLISFDGTQLKVDLSAIKQKGRAKKTGKPGSSESAVEIQFVNVEKANLIPEI